MGFTEILTIIFVILKSIGVIDWSWWIVFLPEIIALVVYILIIVGSLIGIKRTNDTFEKYFDKF